MAPVAHIDGKPALLIDLDGVLYPGDSALAGASDTLHWLNAEKIPHLYVTNTTSVSRVGLLGKFEQFGIQVEVDRIITPIIAASQWLSSHKKHRAALFVTENSLPDFSGIESVDLETESQADAVVIGDDIVGDIGGAQAAGIRSILAKTGKFRELDLQGTIKPDILLDSIADLPAWWAGYIT